MLVQTFDDTMNVISTEQCHIHCALMMATSKQPKISNQIIPARIPCQDHWRPVQQPYHHHHQCH